MFRLPHDRYIDAVLAALTDNDLAPDDSFTDTPDGETLEAVLTWTDHHRTNPVHWPHGVIVSWEHLTGWHCAPRHPDGSAGSARPLLGEPITAPHSVANAVRSLLLHGPINLPLHGSEWVLHSELQAALRKYFQGRQTDV